MNHTFALITLLFAFSTPPIDIVARSSPDIVEIDITVPEGLHLQSNPAGNKLLRATAIELRPSGGVELVSAAYPEPTLIFPEFAPDGLTVYEGTFTVRLRFTGNPGIRNLEAILHYQPCDDKACFQPVAVPFDFEVEITGERPAEIASSPSANEQFDEEHSKLPAASSGSDGPEVHQAQRLPILGTVIDESTRWSLLVFGALFVLGCALNATPCVYPLIPVTIGYFGAQAAARVSEDGGRKGEKAYRFALVAAYGISLAVVFALLGVFAALSGSFLGEAMTNPLVLSAIAALLVGLALWSFGIVEIRIPMAMGAGSKGGLLGAVFMGATAGFVAAPCIGPVVAGLILVVAQTGDLLFGSVAFGVLGLGIAFPLGALGFAASSINVLPKPGEWMVWVKKLFGILLLLGAVYPLLPLIGIQFGKILAAGILVVGAYALSIRDRTAGSRGFVYVKTAFAVIMFVAAVMIATSRSGSEIEFKAFEPGEFSASRQIRIVDVYATWCLPCVELDIRTFADPAVAPVMKKIEAHRIDITGRPPQAIARWLSDHEVVGVPSVLFFDASGREIKELRLLGFEGPAAFSDRLARFLERLANTDPEET